MFSQKAGLNEFRHSSSKIMIVLLLQLLSAFRLAEAQLVGNITKVTEQSGYIAEWYENGLNLTTWKLPITQQQRMYFPLVVTIPRLVGTKWTCGKMNVSLSGVNGDICTSKAHCYVYMPSMLASCSTQSTWSLCTKINREVNLPIEVGFEAPDRNRRLTVIYNLIRCANQAGTSASKTEPITVGLAVAIGILLLVTLAVCYRYSPFFRKTERAQDMPMDDINVNGNGLVEPVVSSGGDHYVQPGAARNGRNSNMKRNILYEGVSVKPSVYEKVL